MASHLRLVVSRVHTKASIQPPARQYGRRESRLAQSTIVGVWCFGWAGIAVIFCAGLLYWQQTEAAIAAAIESLE